MTLLLSLLSSPTILAILAGIIGLFGVGVHQRLAGAKAERARQVKRDLDAVQDRLEMDREATAAELQATRKSDAEALAEALKWQRR